ncbi:MAG: hypothetical protein IJ856_00300 [Candidatus Methanomethylophilaceae archaeon]|nr:hypothetical protein [Candidatus Methanomethylophilaceae archaeon]
MNVRPDGLLGATLAVESLGAFDTLINGAGGCRSRMQIILRDLDPEYRGEDEGCCRSRYFSRQSRLPCTHINGDDIVFGTGPKVADAVKSMADNGKGTVMVETLSASLVCSDYSRDIPPEMMPVLLTGDLSSMSFEDGFDLATREAIASLGIECTERDPVGVNILGYGIPDLGWNYGMEEFRRLLEPMGVHILSFVSCIPGKDALMGSGNASLNVLVRPSVCTSTAEWYSERCGIPYLVPSEGAPVGYSATRAFVREVAEALGLDPRPSLEHIDREEAAVRRMLLNFNRGVDMLRARRFSAEGDSSVLLPLVRWMYEKFMMVPASVVPTDSSRSGELESYLERIGFGGSFGASCDKEVEVDFTDGVTAKAMELAGDACAHIGIGMPYALNVNLIGRCLVGCGGCRFILDSVLNGSERFICGQPSMADMR